MIKTNRIIYSIHLQGNKALLKPVSPFTSKQCELSDGAYIEVERNKSITEISPIDLASSKWLRSAT